MSEKYFLGAMTESGFSTHFGEMVNGSEYYTFILKGGAGTGKSSLMKKIADKFEPTEEVERYYCSSDPASLDAVVLKGSKIIVCDGTAPHVMECSYPGACQKIVNLGQYWDEEMLISQREGIIDATNRNKSLLARSKRYTTALTNVCYDSYCCGLSCLDEEKLKRYAVRFCRHILEKKGSSGGKTYVRQLSVLSEYGYMTQTETLESCMDLYLLCDEYYAASNELIKLTAEEAVRRGFDVILCPSAAFGNSIYEHLIIPEMSVALVSSSPMTQLEDERARKINMSRFYDKEGIAKLKPRLRLDKVTARELSQEVYSAIKKAKNVHDEIEAFYIKAMDFDALNAAAQNVVDTITQLSKKI